MSLRLAFLLLFLLLLPACTPATGREQVSQAVPGPTGVAGMATDRAGAPAARAFVYAYRSPKGGLRGPADFAAEVHEDGSYFLDLVDGAYYLVARRRRGGTESGPPRPGDAWAIYSRNPVVVREGFTSRADFVLQGVTQPMLLRQGSLAAGDTGFTGRIVDGQGRPVSGAFALAYRSPDFRRMPEYTSPAAGEDGIFHLYLPEAGMWCLAVRTRTRGQPMAGELYGVLGEGPQGCRPLENGEILDLGAIVVTPYRR